MKIVHVNAADADLAENWLRQAPGVPTVLVSDLEDAPIAAGIARRHGLRHFVLPDAPDRPEALRLRPLLGHVGDEAVILSEPARMSMVFLGGQEQPAWNDRYPAVRVLHALGVRRFHFQGRTQELRIEVPLLLDGFRNRHAGQRAFVVGNGPSLRNIDMTKLRGQVAFGSNRSFMGYADWGLSFPYWAISDRLQIEMYREEYEAGMDAESIKFIPFEYLGFMRMPNQVPVPMPGEIPAGDSILPFPQFGETPAMLFNSFTVTIVLIQLAVMMGCNPVVLIGVDHTYPIAKVRRRGQDEQDPNPTAHIAPEDLLKRTRLGFDFWEGNTAQGPTHFTNNYTSNRIFVPPRTAWSEVCYSYCSLWGAANGVEIINATPGTHLDAFPKAEFERFV
ncbi:motility associated factor glycosyltransferase family protein [Roseomonas elaeocarpi]|uniref:DUF115 domain-containing protein n=1 Tax=Roseomonas elaeocarpi TaxID=907779 RepID=A0ABV6JR54_9PROT